MVSRQFVRFLATAVKSVKPPVQLYGLDGTYASALYTAAAKSNSLEKSFESVAKLSDTIQKDPKVMQILGNPSLSQGSRKKVVDILSKQLTLDPIVVNLLSVLAENNRLQLFSDVAKQFSVLNDAHHGVVEAHIVSAKPLDERILSRLNTAISGSNLVGRGQHLKITNDIDVSILGGLIVEVGEKSVDLSVLNKVSKMNKVLGESV
ncbi:ATP synthase F0 subcomplex subunit OSCP atp5 [Brettanomyces nanus]|uniref:ATP synthase subunit 5, mitochondrial n=1 Tax=Eeniella nana TaxID=13502 RepID=A0A875S1L8_EENNA|nr:ATP synthase F0 subcomplex subunit OSCP atp5 [Brettanomyces nanus]QPG75631.1 ATP synthase F0 subcomplex subunit OSCP atp5 [Brettanomyces nanus]